MDPRILRFFAAAALLFAVFVPQRSADATAALPGAPPARQSVNVQADGNFIPDGSFELGTVGWSTLHGTASRVSPGRSGNYAVKVMWADPGITETARTVFTFDYYPGAAPNPMVGDVYTATAWLRGEGQTVGKPTFLALREHNEQATTDPSNANTNIVYSRPMTLTASWQQVTITKTIVLTGMTNVDVFAQMNEAVTGDYFLFDDAYMTGPSRVFVPVVLNNAGTNGW